MKYSIALDLLLASVQASSKGKYKTSARFFDAAMKCKDFANTVASLDKQQSQALTSLKASLKAAKAEKAKKAQAAVPKKDAAAKSAKKAQAKTTAQKTVAKPTSGTPGKRMASFLKEIHAKRQAALAAKGNGKPVKAKKSAKASSNADQFMTTIDEMTEASTVDSILDPALDLNTQKDDSEAPETEHIDRSGPDVSGPSETADAMDGDPSPGNGESDLDTDQDDLMDIDDDIGDLSDLEDLSDGDFTTADADGLGDDGDDADTFDGGDDETASSDEDGDDDSDDEDEDEDDDKGGNPFAKKDDKEESKTKAQKAKTAHTPVKAAFKRTVHNLAALDRLTATTSKLVAGTAKKPVKAAAKSAKTASKK
jgi:RNA polymerase primary sigma factor